MTTIGSSPLGAFAGDSGSLKERLGDTALNCPCCNGRLTPEKLARLFVNAQIVPTAFAADRDFFDQHIRICRDGSERRGDGQGEQEIFVHRQ